MRIHERTVDIVSAMGKPGGGTVQSVSTRRTLMYKSFYKGTALGLSSPDLNA